MSSMNLVLIKLASSSTLNFANSRLRVYSEEIGERESAQCEIVSIVKVTYFFRWMSD